MTSIIVLRGFSSSGKSSWAEAQDAIIVSRDAIRKLFPTGRSQKCVLPYDQELLVTNIEIATITSAIKHGDNVIVDNTNLVAKFARRYVDLAVKLGASWEVKDFTTDVETCLAWNLDRSDEECVTYEVITDQARRFPINNWPTIEPSIKAQNYLPYIPDETLPKAIGFDLDGTLAHLTTRSPYDPTRYLEDEVDTVVRKMLWAFRSVGWRIVILTGRDEQYRSICRTWLKTNKIKFDDLFMRPQGDMRNDSIVKSEMINNLVAPKYNLVAVYDDRDRVVQMWRERGVKCFQVACGDF